MGNRLNEEEQKIIRNSLALEKNIVETGLKEYANKLKTFEKNNKMKTSEFIDKFNKGKLGDDSKWFEWAFAYKSFNHLKSKLDKIKGIAI